MSADGAPHGGNAMKKTLLFSVMMALALVVCAGASEIDDLPQFLNSDHIKNITPQPEGQPDNFRFVVIGDTRDGDPMFEYLLHLSQDLNPLFIINVGDVVHAGFQDQYLHHYDQLKDLRVPYISVIGNHEAYAKGGIDRYKRMFGETDNYFDIGNSRFIYFDAAVANGYNLSDEQYAWLEELLKTDRKKFIFMHPPPGIKTWEHGMNKANTAKFLLLMDKYEVERVYVGHVHAYDRYTRNKTTYVMTGGGGAEPDPLSERFYAPMSGGFYEVNMVEVRGDKIMDVLIAPNTADIIDFPSPVTGHPLEFPFAAYRHHNTPIIDNLKIEGHDVSLSAQSNPKALDVGITDVTLSCFDASGKSIDAVSLDCGLYDPTEWTGKIPENASNCILTAHDPVHSGVALLPSITEINPALEGEVAPGDVPFTLAATDPDDPAKITIDDMDIRSIEFAYDDKYFYFRSKVDGEYSEGDKDPTNRIINIYGYILLNDSLELEADISKMLGEVPILAYAPLATSMSIPKCSIIDARAFRDGKFDASDKGLKCMAKGDTLFIRAERELFGPKEELNGFKLISASLQLLMQSRLDVNIGDASNPVHIRMESVKPN